MRDERQRMSVAAAVTKRKNRRVEASRFSTKHAAFVAGDRQGYARAMRWWKSRLEIATSQHHAALSAVALRRT